VESTATPSISRARERISSIGVSMEEGMLPRPGARGAVAVIVNWVDREQNYFQSNVKSCVN
jgi:hypothetical protein